MVENGDPMTAHTFSTFWVVFMAKKCHFWHHLWPKMPFLTMSSPGDPKWLDQGGSRLDQGRPHPGRCVGTFFPFRHCHRGAPEGLKIAPNCHKLGKLGQIPNFQKFLNQTTFEREMEIQHKSMQYHQFGASRATYGPICLIYGILGSFWAVPEHPYGTFEWI